MLSQIRSAGGRRGNTAAPPGRHAGAADVPVQSEADSRSSARLRGFGHAPLARRSKQSCRRLHPLRARRHRHSVPLPSARIRYSPSRPHQRPAPRDLAGGELPGVWWG